MQRLGPEDDAAIEELLLTEPVVNLFLLSMLDRPSGGAWFGHWDGERLLAVVARFGGLIVPYAPDPFVLDALPRPEIAVGPRAAVDALAVSWGDPIGWHDQRLYRCTQPESTVLPVQHAHASDIDALIPMLQSMEREDLGRELSEADARERLEQRIAEGRQWVHIVDDTIRFTIQVGTHSTHGCQLGGTYVPPAHRGQGIARRATAAVCRHLLRRHRVVTLHVREANTPAVRAYEAAGFVPHAPYRVARYAPVGH